VEIGDRRLEIGDWRNEHVGTKYAIRSTQYGFVTLFVTIS